MNKKTWIIIIIVAAIAIFGLYLSSYYNSFVSKDQAVQSQWAQVENQFQRRYDLIPNLVNAVQGILNQEQQIFGDIAQARANYAGAQTVSDKVNAANEVESSLSRLLAIVENYPQLRSSENVQSLQAELAGTENRISVERGRFNEEVQSYNNAVKRFPGNIMAKIFGFDQKPYFEAASGAEQAPEVKLNQ